MFVPQDDVTVLSREEKAFKKSQKSVIKTDENLDKDGRKIRKRKALDSPESNEAESAKRSASNKSKASKKKVSINKTLLRY